MRAKFYFYRNLHTKTFSMQHKQKVKDHPTEALCIDCTFKVSQKLRERVVETRRKNVHAKVGVRGFMPPQVKSYRIVGEVTYNPYTHKEFMFAGVPIKSAKWVLLRDNKIYLVEFNNE